MSYETVTLSDISMDGGSYGIAASAVPYSENLPAYLRITDINDDGTLNLDGLKSVADPNASKYYLVPNDIVFARTGASTGRNYFYDGADRNFVYAGFLIKFSIDPKKVNPLYVKYYCQSKNYYDWVSSFNTGSTRGNINAQMFGNMPLPLPPREQQDTLAVTLSALDALIANNKAINHHLEQIAQAIFKSWFVDFEPFADGGFVESELGEIPSGWRVGTLGECVDFYNGYAFKSNELLDTEEDGCYHVFKMGHIKKGGGFNFDGTKSWIKRDKCKSLLKYVLHPGDLLMCMTDMKGNVALLGHTALMVETDKYIINQRVGLLRANNTHGIDYPFLYILTNYKDFLENLRGRANSGVQVNLSTAEIKASQLPLAPTYVNERFDRAVKPLFRAIFNNQQESAHLATIRETLLPRLMSGELSVADFSVK
jgi:type I restriction enzyme S subunit